MISARRPPVRTRLRTRPRGSPSAALARCIVRVSTRTPSWQQRAVRRIVHIRFYNSGVDAKSTSVRHPARLATSTMAMQLLDDVRSERARDFQDRLRVWHFLGIDAGEGAMDQIGADLTFEIVIAPIEEMLQDQHPQHDIGRGPRASASPTLRPARLERLDDRINHGLVLEQCVDPSATTPATACARRARTLRTDCARAGDAEPCPLL